MEDLYGLIMVGGQSSRMGEDKSLIHYHDKPQLNYLLDIMNSIIDTYVSIRPDQSIAQTSKIVHDHYEVKGPLNGLLSAHEQFPSKAWLTVAVDMPFVNKGTITRLINGRDHKCVATTMIKKKGDLPEPLTAIWEPSGLAKLNDYFHSGKAVYPRNFLLNHQVKLIEAENEMELFNVNNRADLELALNHLKGS